MATITLSGGNFGGETREVSDVEALNLLRITDDAGVVWVYDPSASATDGEAVFCRCESA